ncbi:MAG: hypothetical protein RLZZ455_590 [Candidatus Parcubacteria bacterium]|jgi:hypothetical protein
MKKSIRHHTLPKSPITTSSFLTVLLFIYLLLLLPVKKTFAEVMEDGRYKLQLEEVSDSDPTPTVSNQKSITPQAPSPTPPPVRAYGQSEIIVSDDFVQFGSLSPTNPVLRQLRFSLFSPYAPFSLYQQMNHELQNDPGNTIPATSCDNGSCTITQASLWKSTLTYGLGVRCENNEGTVCPDDFIEQNTFRPLGITASNKASIIASGATVDKNTFVLSYKLVVPGTQAPGNYQASLTYIFVPGL